METLQQDAKQTHFPTYGKAIAAYPDCDHVVTVGPDWNIKPPSGGLFAPVGSDGYYCGSEQLMPVMGSDAYIVADKPTEKPTYTKEMHEAECQSILGMRYIDGGGEECELIGENNQRGVFVGKPILEHNAKYLSVWPKEDCRPIDTRTDEEKLVDDLAEWLELADKTNSATYETKARATIAWLEAMGYRKP